MDSDVNIKDELKSIRQLNILHFGHHQNFTSAVKRCKCNLLEQSNDGMEEFYLLFKKPLDQLLCEFQQDQNQAMW